MKDLDVRPQRIGRFEVTGELGAGLHGTVLRARDPQLGREVAIKVLHDGGGALDVDCVPDEARILGQLRHPNIVSIHEAGIHVGTPYFVMEYVEGTTLRQMLSSRGAFEWRQAVSVMLQVLAGMAQAHDQGVVHLDMSPANVLLDTSGVPRIMDFGLSRQSSTLGATTELLVGTPRYMTPEHFKFAPLGPHTDVYALGLVFYEILTGRAVVGHGELRTVARQVISAEPDWQPLRETGVDPAIESVLRGALAKDAKDRYPDARAMLTALSGLAPTAFAPLVATAGRHATLGFLLRRMQRKQDFPALSRNLVEINRLTAPDSNASAKQLANVVLRDFAISNKLLKMANSAYYGGGGHGTVSNVSDAITLIGFERVRATCNGLVYFSHFQQQGDSTELLDSLIASFVSGLIARHLITRDGGKEAEDAFLCGMFQGLGRSLTLYYLPDEYADIEELVAQGRAEADAARNVLGITFSEMAVAVTREWKFPDVIVDSLKPLVSGVVARPGDRTGALAVASAFAHELCTVVRPGSSEAVEAALQRHAKRFAGCFACSPAQCLAMLHAALEKFQEFAPILGVAPARSRFLQTALALSAGDAATAPAVVEKKPAAAPDPDAGSPAPAAAMPAPAAAPAAAGGLLGRLLRKVGIVGNPPDKPTRR